MARTFTDEEMEMVRDAIGGVIDRLDHDCEIDRDDRRSLMSADLWPDAELLKEDPMPREELDGYLQICAKLRLGGDEARSEVLRG